MGAGGRGARQTAWILRAAHPLLSSRHVGGTSQFYFERVAPALEREGATLTGFFDTVIGPGTTNIGSHRSIELRRFPDLTSWQRWREAQETDQDLEKLVKESWLSKVERVESVLLHPLDYSRIR